MVASADLSPNVLVWFGEPRMQLKQTFTYWSSICRFNFGLFSSKMSSVTMCFSCSSSWSECEPSQTDADLHHNYHIHQTRHPLLISFYRDIWRISSSSENSEDKEGLWAKWSKNILHTNLNKKNSILTIPGWDVKLWKLHLIHK